jgi:hypothetical protein
MKVTKEERDFGPAYFLTEGETTLRISLEGNFDLYWQINNQQSRKEKKSAYKDVYETMLITKENYTIYKLFEDLIRELKNCEVYKPEEIVLEPTFADEFDICDIFDIDPFSLSEEDEHSLTESYRRTKAKEANERIKKTTKYDLLTKDSSITWYSDDASIEAADVVRLSIVEGGILLEFTRPDLDPTKNPFCYPGLLNIRFSNSGSRYDELVNIFNRMYQNLQEYEPDYHQIHLEELDYQKKLLLEKKDN